MKIYEQRPARLPARLPVWLLTGAASFFGLAALTTLTGCGLEACGSINNFDPTPEPEAILRGKIDAALLSEAVAARVADASWVVRATSVDGAVLSEATVKTGEEFSLPLGAGQSHFNIRLSAVSGGLVLRTMLAEAAAGQTISNVGMNERSTAAAIVADRYAVRERGNLASAPPTTMAAVFANASGEDAAVAAFRDAVVQVLETSSSGGTEPSLAVTGFAPVDAALVLANLDATQYNEALENAVTASAVPIVCDPGRIRTLFTVDASGQAKDGNGAAQFIRQPAKENKIFLGITLDPTSSVPDSAGVLRPRLTPNDPQTEMFDDGTHGDEQAGDGIYTTFLDLPRGIRVLYKYTNGSAGEGFTGTEEWPGNARILLVDDVLTSSAAGTPDCLVVRRDSFGDESSNKNFVNLHARLAGGDLGYDDDLGGPIVPPAAGEGFLRVGGLERDAIRQGNSLTPQGIPEARENGICRTCPAPLTVSADDSAPPRVVAAAFLSATETRVVFSEEIDLQSGGNPSNYVLVDADNTVISVRSVRVVGSSAILTHDAIDPRQRHSLAVKDVADASLARNPIAAGTKVVVAPDITPPQVTNVRAGSIVEVNPAALPSNPETGEVVVVGFSELLDKISAENASNYKIDGLDVYAAYQKGTEVFLVTGEQTRGANYSVTVSGVFDRAGNLAAASEPTAFRGLSLSLVTFRAVVDFAWLSADGLQRGLPTGQGLYLTGTVAREARGPDGRDLRVLGRTDVAGLDGMRFEPSSETVAGKPVYTLQLRLPAGNYAAKLAYGSPEDALNPPTTLETVSKNLATRNDSGGVSVDPITMQGRDGGNYSAARLSLSGQDLAGPGVLFKRENPDDIIAVGEIDRILPIQVVGTWRDVPFGRGADYDDGLVELPMLNAQEADSKPPALLGVKARDSESVLVSFDELVVADPAAVQARVTGDEGDLNIVEVIVGQPLVTQVVVRTGAMALDKPYTLAIAGLADAAGNTIRLPITVGFTSPGAFSPFVPVVDTTPPAVAEVVATSPTEIEVRFSERVTEGSIVAANFSLTAASGAAPQITAVRAAGGGRKAVLTTQPQERQKAYQLAVRNISDVFDNTLSSVTVPFVGFGEFDPPEIVWAKAVTPTLLAMQWNEPVTADSAGRITNYLVSELNVTAVRFGGADDVKTGAFNSNFAPLSRDLVLLSLASPMTAGGQYTVTVEGVSDISGNQSNAVASFVGVGEAPKVDVVLSYLISDTAEVLGAGGGGSGGTPARAISSGTLASQREGVFVLGTALNDAGSQPVVQHPFTQTMTGFPAEGAPLDGVEPELVDNGSNGDAAAGDKVFTIVVRGVPLGSTLAWKAFAPFTAAFGQANPQVPGAAFADAPRGPAVFADGQEFPGNDNAVFLVADIDGDGKIFIENLFGDEITYKRKTGFPAFHWAIDRTRRAE